MLPDINCDMGEGIGNDEQIMPYIRSANIACGYHAGDVTTMQETIALCIKYGVAVGAHPSFYDRIHFGRKEMSLPAHELYDLLWQQLIIFSEVASSLAVKMNHVKPHGALYNLAAKDPLVANVIARAVKDFDDSLVLVGLSGSHAVAQAEALGLKTMNEVFADRSYQDDGSLTSRLLPGSLLENAGSVVQQVLQMIKEGCVTTVTGKKIPLQADTVCVHGDGPQAAEFAKAIHEALQSL